MTCPPFPGKKRKFHVEEHSSPSHSCHVHQDVSLSFSIYFFSRDGREVNLRSVMPVITIILTLAEGTGSQGVKSDDALPSLPFVVCS